MNKNGNAIFKQAFDELENEGYFDDISAKIKRSGSSATVKARTGSFVRSSSASSVARPRAYVCTTKGTKGSARTPSSSKTKKVSKISKSKARAR